MVLTVVWVIEVMSEMVIMVMGCMVDIVFFSDLF